MVLIILSLILAIIIVNALQKLLMAITGTSVMFYSMASKIAWYGIAFGMIYYFIGA